MVVVGCLPAGMAVKPVQGRAAIQALRVEAGVLGAVRLCHRWRARGAVQGVGRRGLGQHLEFAHAPLRNAQLG